MRTILIFLNWISWIFLNWISWIILCGSLIILARHQWIEESLNYNGIESISFDIIFVFAIVIIFTASVFMAVLLTRIIKDDL